MTRGGTRSPWTTLGWALLLLLLISWPIRYAQQIAFGQVVIYTGLLRIILFLTLFALALLTASRAASRDQYRLLGVGYLVVSMLLYNLLVADFGAFYLAFGFNFFVVPAAIAFVFFLNSRYFPVRGKQDERAVTFALLTIAVPVALFGILQYALNDSILQTGFAGAPRSEYGEVGQAALRLTELTSTHRIRANSIFGSAIEFGNFAVLFAILSFGLTLHERNHPWRAVGYALLTAVFLGAVVATNTRNILLFLCCCGIGCLLICAGMRVHALIATAFALIAVFYTAVYGVVSLAPAFFAGFFDPVSLYQRARGVYVTVQQFIVGADSITHVLFGYGYMQSEDFSFLPTTIFDNSELDVYLYAGVCGVILYFALLLVLLVFSIRQWRETHKIAWLAAASVLFGTPLFSTINIDLDQPFFVFVFALVAAGAATPSGRTWSTFGAPVQPIELGLTSVGGFATPQRGIG